ncbi:MAG: hypothetical protein JW734_07180 [Candidatus Omnitrophica bacterium]|nr:hypothetical protein [Candidatus Omnitrophota bacterium]
MDFTCPLCGKHIPKELLVIMAHTEAHIIEEIKKKHPEWAKEDALCKKCYEYYKQQLRLD